MKLVTVARYDHPFQADLAAALLEDAGIGCVLAGAPAAGMYPFFSRSSGGFKVSVAEERADEARAVLAGADEAGR